MKLTSIFAAVVIGVAGLTASAMELPSQKDVVVGINDVFIPGGFDSDSDVYVVVSGLFPNSCYRWKEAKVAHDRQEGVHAVQATASVSQGMCLMVLVPYSKEVQLGKLGAGEHKIRFLNGDGTYMERTLTLE